jgi:hypothetical protein
MAARARGVPRVGAPVTVVFLAAKVRGTVHQVDPDLHGLDVVTDDGDTVRFELSRLTGRFMSEGQSGPRLFFEDRATRRSA